MFITILFSSSIRLYISKEKIPFWFVGVLSSRILQTEINTTNFFFFLDGSIVLYKKVCRSNLLFQDDSVKTNSVNWVTLKTFLNLIFFSETVYRYFRSNFVITCVS